MKAVVAAFNQEKALVGAFSVITNLWMQFGWNFFKHFSTHIRWSGPHCMLLQEYSTDVGDPYYPVPNPRNQELYAKYQRLAEQEEGVTFVGRLASYKYFNMDQAILNALELFDKLVEEKKITKRR